MAFWQSISEVKYFDGVGGGGGGEGGKGGGLSLCLPLQHGGFYRTLYRPILAYMEN